MINESLTLSGELHVVLKDKDGNVKIDRLDKNLVVQAGKNYVSSSMIASATTPMVAMALGTGTAAPSTSDTALQTELVRTLFQSTSQNNSAVTMVGFYGAGVGTGAITEAGIFNNGTTGGTMLSRIVFSVVNKAATDTLTITWTVTLS